MFIEMIKGKINDYNNMDLAEKKKLKLEILKCIAVLALFIPLLLHETKLAEKEKLKTCESTHGEESSNIEKELMEVIALKRQI